MSFLGLGDGSDHVGHVNITNATSFRFVRVAQETTLDPSMWDFPETVIAQGQATARASFCGVDSATAVATYQVDVGNGDDNPSFTFKITKKDLRVDYSQLSGLPGWVAVPPPPNSIANVTWRRNSTASFTLSALGGMEGTSSRSFGAPTPAPPAPQGNLWSLGGCGGWKRPQLLLGFTSCLEGNYEEEEEEEEEEEKEEEEGGGMSVKAVGTRAHKRAPWTADWMGRNLAALKDLHLYEMSLPGTHDSGTKEMELPLAAPWATTQNQTLTQQLEGGARVLDLRVGHSAGKEGAEGTLVLVHDTWKTKTSLKDAMGEVLRFVRAHPREIVFLDFHRFPDLGSGTPPHVLARDEVKACLGEEILINPKDAGKPLGKLISQKGRVAVLWNAKEAHDPLFFRGLRTEWRGDTSIQSLHEFFTKVFEGPKRRVLWSLSAVLPPGIPLPIPHIGQRLDEWFGPGGTWQDKANIVSVDFIEESRLVPSCVGACLMKAARLRAQNPPGEEGA